MEHSHNILSHLLRELEARGVPARCGVDRDDFAHLLQNNCWKGLPLLFTAPQSRLCCADVLEVCAPAMAMLSPTAPEGGWLSFLFDYAKHLAYPDAEFSHFASPFHAGAELYLGVLQVCLAEERCLCPFDPTMDFAFLSPQEAAAFDRGEDYARFLRAWQSQYIYELLRLGEEASPYRALGHVAGVHHVAMTAARGLLDAGLPVDLALASGAAAGHDLGKFGCKPGERVPYLHYHYTDVWFRRIGLPGIGAIAANHSTWDLELANLPSEALCLIYADFRVKQQRDASGRELPKIFTLDEAFQVILSKLDNVDETKLRRYRFVYARLHDFEDYMRTLGVDVALCGHPALPRPLPEASLCSVDEAIQSLIFMGTEHNIRVMDILIREKSFAGLLESARSEKNWQHIRSYLDILGEYSTYLRPAQKVQALDFLYELLMHREGDIRRRAAGLLGQLIAQYNAGYRKEIPADAPDTAEQTVLELWEQLLTRIISPAGYLTAQHKSRMRFTLKLVVKSLFTHAEPATKAEFFRVLMNHYRIRPEALPVDDAFCLLDNLYDLPFALCGSEELSLLVEFAAFYFTAAETHLRIAAARFYKQLAGSLPADHPARSRIAGLAAGMNRDGSTDVTMLFLQMRILQELGQDFSALQAQLSQPGTVNEIFLENLKTGTHWVRKAVNIKFLASRAETCGAAELLHIATHLANLVKVSESIVVRYGAGAALLRVAGRLSPEQCNEITVELFKGLETGEYEFSKYIPACLGEVALFLPPEQLDELVQSLRSSLASANERVVCVALDTVGFLLECAPAYPERFVEAPQSVDLRRRYLLGFLLAGLANHRAPVRQESLLILGRLFSSARLPMEEKKLLFGLCCKKLLFLLSETHDSGRTEYYRAAALTQICRFITVCSLEKGLPTVPEYERVAFFPGTFDPFTLSHKGIVRAIRNMGFEVYLAVDEFSWSKNTQPHLIRRQIVNMSVPDMFHVHLFPSNIPVNLASPEDLGRLRELFAGREVFLVAGSDVLSGASAYRQPPQKNSVHSFPHILFLRGTQTEQAAQQLADSVGVSGQVITLSLPAGLEDISSTRIRDNLDQGRDISNLIDPVVQEYIYSSSVYLRAARFKSGLAEAPGTLHLLALPSREQLSPLLQALPSSGQNACLHPPKNSDWMVLHAPSPTDAAKPGAPLALGAFSALKPEQAFSAFSSLPVTDLLRTRAGGPILLLQGLWLTAHAPADAAQLVLSEILAAGLERGCTYAVWLPHTASDSRSPLSDVLQRQGFVAADFPDAPTGMMLCDMHRPLLLLHNLGTTFKEPLASLPALQKISRETHARLQHALAKLYPGNLVLDLSSAVIQQRLAAQITAQGGVPETPTEPRVLGPLMCVPFGKLLRGRVVPNTVTKTLHTDRVYAPDLSSSQIEAYPGYSSLQSQIRTIKSFGRPVVLVDDLLHQNGRLSAILPLFAAEHVEIEAVTLGVLSAYGADSMARSGLPVTGVYQIPALRRWFVESTLYPFIGGDTVRRPGAPVAGLLPTINQILPYTYPSLPECERQAVYDFSEVCLQNAHDIFVVLENEYRRLFGRNLTLGRLGEAVILPTCPDRGSCMRYDASLAASVYLENDLEQFRRTRRNMK